MSKKCLTCGITCSSCRGGYCKCGMNQKQINMANSLLTELTLEESEKAWLIDLVKKYNNEAEVITELRGGLTGDLEEKYTKKVVTNNKIENYLCQYEGFGVWSRCINCGVARRDKQHDSEKKCFGKTN